MNVANLELCKELYKLSGWGKTDFLEIIATDKAYCLFPDRSNELQHYLVDGRSNRYQREYPNGFYTPAYDLGYLLRKLPRSLTDNREPNYLSLSPFVEDEWEASYLANSDKPMRHWYHAQRTDTPENALCELAIELFKQGILKNEP